MPAVAAAEDVHAPLAVPANERGEAPFLAGVLPVSAVRLVVGEGRVSFVDRGDGIRVSGLETAEFVFLIEVGVRNVTVALGEVRLEEDHLNLVAFAMRHGINNAVGDVFAPTRGIKHLLGCAVAVDGNATNDQIALSFNTFADHLNEFFGE